MCVEQNIALRRKNNTVCRDHVIQPVCELVVATKLVVGFLWNAVERVGQKVVETA